MDASAGDVEEVTRGIYKNSLVFYLGGELHTACHIKPIYIQQITNDRTSQVLPSIY